LKKSPILGGGAGEVGDSLPRGKEGTWPKGRDKGRSSRGAENNGEGKRGSEQGMASKMKDGQLVEILNGLQSPTSGEKNWGGVQNHLLIERGRGGPRFGGRAVTASRLQGPIMAGLVR